MAVKITIEINEDLRQRAKALAASQGRSLADVVRSAIKSYVEQTPSSELPLLIEIDPIFQMAGKYSGSSENVSELV